MKFSISHFIVTLSTFAAIANAAPPSALDIRQASPIPASFLGPEDFLYLGGDGVLRVYSTVDYAVKTSVALTPVEIADVLDKANATDEIRNLFEGVNGHDATPSQRLEKDVSIGASLRAHSEPAASAKATEEARAKMLLESRGLTCAAFVCDQNLNCATLILVRCKACVLLPNSQRGVCAWW